MKFENRNVTNRCASRQSFLVDLFVHRQRNKTLSLLVGACDVETASEIFSLLAFVNIDFGHLCETTVIEEHSIC